MKHGPSKGAALVAARDLLDVAVLEWLRAVESLGPLAPDVELKLAAKRLGQALRAVGTKVSA